MCKKDKITWSPHNRRHYGAFEPKMLLGIFIFMHRHTHTHARYTPNALKTIFLCAWIRWLGRHCCGNAVWRTQNTQSVYEFNVTPWSHRSPITKAYFCIHNFFSLSLSVETRYAKIPWEINKILHKNRHTFSFHVTETKMIIARRLDLAFARHLANVKLAAEIVMYPPRVCARAFNRWVWSG